MEGKKVAGLKLFSLNLLFQHSDWKFSLLNALLKASSNILFLVVFTVFLKNQGYSYLPYFYVLLILSFLFCQLWMLFISSFSALKILKIINQCFNVSALVYLFFIASLPFAFIFFFLLMILLQNNMVNLMYMEYLSNFYTLQKSKQRIPGILAAGTLGNIISGLTVKLLLEWVSLNTIFAIGLFIQALATILVLGLRESEQPRQSIKTKKIPVRKPREIGFSAILDFFKPVTRKNLLAYLLIFGFLFFFLRYLIDYGFSYTVDTMYGSEKELASFLGVFRAVADIFIMLAQYFLVGRLLTQIRIGLLLGIIPALMMSIALWTILSENPIAMIVAQLVITLLFKVIFQPITHVIVNPFSETKRPKIRVSVNFSCSLGSLAISLAILFFKDELTFLPIAWIGLFISLFFIWTTIKIDRSYISTIVKSVASLKTGFSKEIINSLQYTPYEVTKNELGRLLVHDQVDVRMEALEGLGQISASDRSQFLERLIAEEKNATVQATAIKMLLRDTVKITDNYCRDLFSRFGDARVRANIVEVLTTADLLDNRSTFLQTYLHDENHRLRASVVIWILRQSDDKDLVFLAMKTLADMLVNEKEPARSSAAYVMGYLAHGFFLPALATLLEDKSAKVRRNALVSLGISSNHQALAIIDRFLADESEEDLLTLARDIRARIHDATVSNLSTLLEGFTTEETKKLEALFQSVGESVESERIRIILTLEDTELRHALVKYIKLEKNNAALDFIFAQLQRRPFKLDPVSLKEFLDRNNGKLNGYFFQIIKMISADDQLEGYKDFIFKLCTELWIYSLLLVKGGDDPSVEENTLSLLRQRRDDALSTIAHMCASLAPKRHILLEAFNRTLAGDKFERSLALELIGSYIPKRLAKTLFPIIGYYGNPLKMIRQIPDELQSVWRTIGSAKLKDMITEEGKQCLHI